MFVCAFALVAIALVGCDSARSDQAAAPATAAVAADSAPSAPAMKPAVAPSAVAAVRLSVEGLTCEGCAWQIRDSLEKHPGVIAVRTHVPTKRVTIEYDSTRTTAAAIAAELHKSGYDGVADPSDAMP